MKILELFLIIMILLNLYLLLDKYFFNEQENFATDFEAIANVASLYNNSNMTVSNMTVTQNANISNSVTMNTQDLGGPGQQTRINQQGIIFGGANNGRELNSAQISAGRHVSDSLCIVGMSDANHQNRKINMWSEGGTTHNGPMKINGTLEIGNILLSDAGDGTLLITGKGMTLTDNNSDNKFKFELSADDTRANNGGQRMTIKNKNNNRTLDIYQDEVKDWRPGVGEPVTIFSRTSNDPFWNNRSYLNVRDYGLYGSTTACGTRTDGHFGCNLANALS